MTTQYSPILKLALPVQGELSGTWGDVVNDNITSMVEQAIAGRAVINTWTTNSHTLTTANGVTSESRCAMLELTDTGTALSAAGTVICPAASKIYIVKNASGQNITVKTSGGTGILVPDGRTTFLFCDGTNVVEAMTHTTSLQLGTSTVVTAVLDEDNMASDSATSLATQQSIKAYVDSQVGANNELSEVLANGNTSGANDIIVDNGQKITVDTIDETTAAAGVTIDSVLLKDDGVNATNLEVTNIKANDGTTAATIADSTGVVTVPSAVLTTADINGGTADNVVIGGTTPAAATATTVTANTSLNIAGTVTVTSILDEDNMASDDPAGLATQQSIKAYVDAQVGTADELSEVLANGNTTGGNNILFGDDDKAIFGAGSDLQIYHQTTGTVGSYISDQGAGPLNLLSGGVRLKDTTDTDTMLAANAGGSVTLYYDNAPKLATTSTGVDVTGTITSDGLTVDGVATVNSNILEVSSTAPNIRLTETDITDENTQLFSGGGTFRIRTASDDYSTVTERIRIDHGTGDISFYEDTGTTPKFFWDASAESLGIGTTTFPSSNTRIALQGTQGASGSGTNVAADEFFIDNNGDTGMTLGSANDGVGYYAFADPDVAIRGGLFYDHSTDDMGFRVASQTRMTLDSGGKVGIGTALPLEPLHVQEGGSSGMTPRAGTIALIEGVGNTKVSIASGTTSTGELLFGSSTDNDAGRVIYDHSSDDLSLYTNSNERMRIDSVGNVGIGTDSPKTNLDLSSVTGPQITLTRSQGTNIAGDTLGRLNFYNSDFSGDGANNAAIIEAVASTSTGAAADLLFRTKTAGTEGADAVEAMRIDRDGNVGIGTSSPTGLLELSAITGSGSLNLVSTQNAANAGQKIAFFGADRSDAGEEMAYIQGLLIGNSGGAGNVQTGQLAFGTSGEERMRIDSNGDVAVTGSVNIGNDLNITGPSPAIKLTDDDTADEYTKIQNASGATFIDSRDGTENGAIVFRGDGGGVSDEYARFIANGNFGIGVANPTHELSVVSAGDTTVEIKSTGTGDADAILILDSADSGESVVSFMHDGVEGARIEWFTDGSPDLNIVTVAGSDGVIDFQPNNSLAMRIDSNGDVSITDGDLTINGGTVDGSIPKLTIMSNENAIAAGEALGTISFASGDDSGGAAAGNKGTIKVDATGDYTSTFGGSRMEFFTSTTAGVNTRAGYFDDAQKLVLDAGMSLTSNEGPQATVTASITGTTMTVTAVASGTIAVGMYVVRSGVSPNTQITGFISGSGGNGTYTVSISQTTASASYYLRDEFSNRLRFNDVDTSVATDQVFGTIDWVSADNAGTKGFLLVEAQDGSPDSNMIFGTNHLAVDGNHATEKMRLTYDGHLLVGTTDTGPWNDTSGAGIALRSDGIASAAASGTTALRVNRTSTDGNIAEFYKNGASVGSIGVASGDLMIGTTDTGLRFLDGSEAIIPWDVTGNTNKNGVLDLGNNSNRFDNLYLSGGVVFADAGGVGPSISNTLDSYETGTFTMGVTFSTTAPTAGPTQANGYYVKTGNSCTIWLNVNNINVTGGAGDLRLNNVGGFNGLPFVSRGIGVTGQAQYTGSATISHCDLPSTAIQINAQQLDGINYIRFTEQLDSAATDVINVANCTHGATDITLCMTYPVA